MVSTVTPFCGKFLLCRGINPHQGYWIMALPPLTTFDRYQERVRGIYYAKNCGMGGVGLGGWLLEEK